MSQTTLHTRYQEHTGKVSDKWSIYLDVYQNLFEPFVDCPISLLEIGIQNGGSLEIWANHFPNARHLVGCDIDPNCAQLRYEDPRVAVIVGDANNDASEQRISAVSPDYDIVIDDGSHTSGDIVRAFIRYFKRVKDGGFFLAEDLHCSYWKEFDGGLFDPQSSIAFFKRLVDVVNHEHWGVPGERAAILRGFVAKYGDNIDEELLASVHSVEFFNSICVVRKASAQRNELGRRIFAGTSDVVSSERLTMPAGKAPPPSQKDGRWSDIGELPEERAERLAHELRAQTELALGLQEAQLVTARATEESRQTATAQLEEVRQAAATQLEDARQAAATQLADAHQASAAQIEILNHQLNAMKNSFSWRLTAPLRAIRRSLG